MRISTLIPLLSGVSVAVGQYYEARKLTEIQPSNTRFTDLAFRGETGYILLTAVGGTVQQFDSFHQHGGPQTLATVVQQELAGIVELDTDRYGVTAWSQNGDAPTMSLYELDLTEPATAMWPIGSPNRTPVNIKLGGLAAINSHISFQVDTGAALRGINWADGTLFKDPYFDQIQPGTIGIAYRAPNLYVTDAQAGTLKRVKVNEVTGAVFPSTFETLVTSSFLKGCAGIALSHWNEDIFVTNPTLGAILRVNLQTKTVRFVSVNSIVKPVAAEFAPWGGLYVAAQGDNSVGSSVWSVKVPDEPAR